MNDIRMTATKRKEIRREKKEYRSTQSLYFYCFSFTYKLHFTLRPRQRYHDEVTAYIRQCALYFDSRDTKRMNEQTERMNTKKKDHKDFKNKVKIKYFADRLSMSIYSILVYMQQPCIQCSDNDNCVCCWQICSLLLIIVF